ncbi:MAG: hypothetical protein IKO55_07500, partial [Kiritimatiellae bacterium]|nr:hypothetical protein [Kiritimatiellia bacterium]
QGGAKALSQMPVIVSASRSTDSALARDILEWNVPEEVLAVLLKDRSTGRNRICATDEKENFTNGI